MSTGDLIGTVYFATTGVVAVAAVVAVVSYAILAEESGGYGLTSIRDKEDRWFLGVFGSWMSMLVGLMWPLVLIAGVVAVPALTVRYRRESAAKKKREQVASLKAAAELFPRGSEERRLLTAAALEAGS